jgi:hypothetical protein
MTKNNKYIPTTAEQKLLEVLCNTESLGKSITDICTQADISRNVYYEAIKKPEFFDYRNELLKDVIKAGIGDIINASMKYAKDNPRNYQDRLLIAKIAEFYKDEQNINLNTNVNTINGKSVEEMTDEELDKFINSKQEKKLEEDIFK